MEKSKVTKFNLNLYLILIIVVACFPKINIINVPGSSTGIRIDDILIAITLFIMILSTGKEIFNDKNIKKITTIFLVYSVSCVISIIFGTLNGYISPLLGALHLTRKIEYFIFIFFGYRYFKYEQQNPKILKIVNCVVVFHLLVCILQYFGLVGSFNAGEALDYLTQGRVSSTFNGAYELSAFLLLLLPIYLYNIFSKSRQTSGLYQNLFFIGIIFLCIFISESRISFLAFIAIVILMFYHFKVKNNKKNFAIIVITIFVAILGLSALKSGNSNISKRLNEISISGFIESTSCAWEYKDFDLYLSQNKWYGNYACMTIGTDSSWNLRVNHWMQLIDGALRNPLFGLGLSIAGSASDGEYVRILTESGLLGLLLWGYLLYKLVCIFNKHQDNKLCVISKYALFGMLIGAIFIDVFSASKVIMIFWFLVGMSYSSIFEDENEERSNS